MTRYDDLQAILKEQGYSLTKPRKIIFDLLYKQDPQSMQVLVSRAKSQTDRATVYRTVELFEQLGIVHRLNIGLKYKLELSDVFQAHHHHFYCTSCSKTYTLDQNTMLETMINTVASQNGFRPRGHNLEVEGICPNCQTKP